MSLCHLGKCTVHCVFTLACFNSRLYLDVVVCLMLMMVMKFLFLFYVRMYIPSLHGFTRHHKLT